MFPLSNERAARRRLKGIRFPAIDRESNPHLLSYPVTIINSEDNFAD